MRLAGCMLCFGGTSSTILVSRSLFLRYVGGTSSKPVLSMPPTPVTRCPRYLPALSRRNVGPQPTTVPCSCRSLRFAPLASSHSGMYRANNLFLPYFISRKLVLSIPLLRLPTSRYLSSSPMYWLTYLLSPVFQPDALALVPPSTY